MNLDTKLYRKRFIPNETIYLKDDLILYTDESYIITKWNCLRPRSDIAYGYSLYCLEKGYKISKVFNFNNDFVYWYCDIVTYDYQKETNELTVIDLLADVIVYEDGSSKVLDLDELADSLEQGLIPLSIGCKALRQANALLSEVYSGKLKDYQNFLSSYEQSK
ncbi:MAG: DUF402 domain-containing protein [bacterium]|nr:DUF402 domain-containing protein [bacterium]